MHPSSARRRRGDDPALSVADVVVAGHRGDAATARAALASADPRVREVAVGALARTGSLDVETVVALLEGDDGPAVRRRACDSAALFGPDQRVVAALVGALCDPDPLVVESACWTLGELFGDREPEGADNELAAVLHALGVAAGTHPDARAREAAVAALGTVGDERAVPAVLAALGDRPSVRRRAVVALAAFEGQEVLAALRASAEDRDWQVREVAEILLDEDPVGPIDVPRD